MRHFTTAEYGLRHAIRSQEEEARWAGSPTCSNCRSGIKLALCIGLNLDVVPPNYANCCMKL
ncbi:hypothetical protein [Anabaena azotica]|uniref:hypothetical protein n=1 Tax=Anabaena azotica TaxID=197653 RepID=UPI0039A6EC3B